MADDRENQRRRDGKKSRSTEETESSSYCDFSGKGRNLDLRSSKSGWMSDERHEIDSRSRAEKKDKEGQIGDYKDSSNADTRENQQQQRQRNVEMQRRRYETESRIWREERDRSPDRRRYDGTALDWGDSNERTPEYRRSESERRDHERTLLDNRGNETEWRYDERTGRRYERLESGGYIVHPGKNDCFNYFRTGTCHNGRSICKLNHPTTLPQELPEKTSNVPVCKHFLRGHCKKGSDCDFPHTMARNGAEPMPQELPEKTNVRVCKFFPKGTCKKGADCDFSHTMDRGGAEPMPQARSMDRKTSESKWGFYERTMDQRVSDSESIFDEITERRYETDSGYRPEKRSRTIPDSRLRDPSGTFENLRQRSPEIEWECEQERRVEIPENPFIAAQMARERREAQDNMQEQRSGGRTIYLSHLINPIANEILRERKSQRKREIERLSREESPIRSSQQSNSIN